MIHNSYAKSRDSLSQLLC